MKERRSKIHKIGPGSDRVVPIPEEERRAEPVRYVVYDPSQANDDDTIDLLALWRILVNYKRVMATVFFAALALAVSAAFFMTPVYRAELVMAPVVEEENSGISALAGQFGGLASLAGVNLSKGNGGVEKSLAILESRAFLLTFFKQENIYQHLYPEFWDAKRGTWLTTNSGVTPTALDAYDYFTKDILKIKNHPKSGLVTLSVDWADPKLAAQWANRLVERLNEHQRQFAVSEAERSIEYLDQQLKETRVVDMQQVIYRLIESQTKVIMLANVKKEYAMQVIDPAVIPEERVSPQRTLMIVAGVFLGLFGSVLVVFVLNFFRNIKQLA